MSKCDFHVDTNQLIKITLLLGCFFVNLLPIFRNVSQKNTLRGMLLNITTNKRHKGLTDSV